MIPGSSFRLFVAAAQAAVRGGELPVRLVRGEGDAGRNVRSHFHPFSNPPYGIRKMQRFARKRRNQLRNKRALRRVRL